MVVNFKEYVQKANVIENDNRMKLIGLKKQLINIIVNKHGLEKQDVLYISINLDREVGELRSFKRLTYLKDMEDELGIMLREEDKLERLLWDYDGEVNTVQYIYYFDIMYD